MQVPTHREDRAQHGRRRGVNDRKKVDSAAARPRADRRPEAGRSRKSRKVDRRPSSCARACRSAAKVTLRGDRMYEFLDRLVTIALPRVQRLPRPQPEELRRTRQLRHAASRSTSCFPEIDYDKVDQIWGMDIIVCTTAETDDEARALAARLQFPVPQLEDLGIRPKGLWRTEWPRQVRSRRTTGAAAGRAVRGRSASA